MLEEDRGRSEVRHMLRSVLKKGALVGAALAFLAVAIWAITGWIGYRPYPDPPRVGEPVAAVVQRLGAPHYDSRKGDRDGKDEYQLGYTDGVGTRYLLTVKDGYVTHIEYSSR